MPKTPIFIACLSAVMLAACDTRAPVNSFSLTSGATSSGPISGVPYALPLSRIRLLVTGDNAKGVSMTLSRESFADPSARYVANATLSRFSHDKIKLGVTPDGLLNLATSESDEQSDVIVTTFVDSITSANVRVAGSTTKVKPVNLLIDPYTHDNSHRDGVRLTWLGNQPKPPAEQPRDPCPTGTSICVPVMVPLLVEYDKTNVKLQAIIAVPHPQKSIGIALHRRPCTQTVTKLSVADGVLTSFDIDKPSEIAGCLSIPLKIVTAIVAAPVNAFKSEKKALDAQRAALEAQKDLLKTQMELQALQLESKTPTSTGSGTGANGS